MPAHESISNVLGKAQNVYLDFARSSQDYKKAKEEHEAYEKAFEEAIEAKGLWGLFMKYDSARNGVEFTKEDAALEAMFFYGMGYGASLARRDC